MRRVQRLNLSFARPLRKGTVWEDTVFPGKTHPASRMKPVPSPFLWCEQFLCEVCQSLFHVLTTKSRGAGPFHSVLISRCQTATGRPGRRERGPSTTDRTEEEMEAMSSTVSDLLDGPHREVIPDWFPLRAALGAPWLQHSERARSKFKTVASGMYVWFSHGAKLCGASDPLGFEGVSPCERLNWIRER